MAAESPTIQLEPAVLRWARERAELGRDTLATKLGVQPEVVDSWETTGQIRCTQIEQLASKTHTPLGALYLPQPPDERLPIQDFRRLQDSKAARPTTELIDTLYAMQRRQAWMHDELVDTGEGPLGFVGSLTIETPAQHAATALRAALGLADGWNERLKDAFAVLRCLREAADDVGILVVINGVVGNNSHRPLRVEEFRGFTLVDTHAPLVFVNGRDAPAARTFTLAHELVHVLLGSSGISGAPEDEGDSALPPSPSQRIEQFCNAVAAEFLVPTAKLRSQWTSEEALATTVTRVAEYFGVSRPVIARRARDLRLVTSAAFFSWYQAYRQESEDSASETKRSGGNTRALQKTRIGRRFGTAVVRAVREDRLLYRDAYLLTGLKAKSFDAYASDLGFS